jgi:hypothetical protein
MKYLKKIRFLAEILIFELQSLIPQGRGKLPGANKVVLNHQSITYGT